MKGKLNMGINLLLVAVFILTLALDQGQALAKKPAIDGLTGILEGQSLSDRWSRRPVQAPEAAGDGKWDRRFFGPGTNVGVEAIAVSGSNLFVGGSFTQVGGISAIRIAKWDSLSQTWSALGGGVGNVVHDIAVSGPFVFVGGNFTDVDGNSEIQYIAMWDSAAQSWSPLGDGVNGQVWAVAVSGSKVYVGGQFTEAGGITVNGIAVWDLLIQSWSRLGCGVRSQIVKEITVDNDVVFVGGSFSQVGDQWDPSTNSCVGWESAPRLVAWSGEGWSSVGGGVNSTVNAIAVSENNLYVGGSFTNAGGIAEADRIARWDGSQWHALDNGLNGGVNDIAFLGSEVYVGGNFTDAGGIAAADRIARWDGSQWNALGGGVNHNVITIAMSDTDIYAGGIFGLAGGGRVNSIARWDGDRWYSLGAGLTGLLVTGAAYVEDIARSGESIYAGGNFTDAGGAKVNGIARWDGRDWWPLGSGFTNVVEALAVNNGAVYAGGSFTDANGIPEADRIARWDGSQWQSLGGGLNGVVYAIALLGDDVFVGGAFTDAGGIAAADRIARWDGSQWHAVGGGMPSGAVYAIAVLGNDVYVGGTFINAGGLAAADRIARWNGIQWHALDNGLNGPVYDIAFNGNDVYAGGTFTNAGGIPEADRIARWDGITWSPLGTGIGIAVYAIAILEDKVYVGGEFNQAGGVPANNIARWDKSSGWSALGSGTDNRVRSLAVTDTDVYVGGLFRMAGGRDSLYFGRYTTKNIPPALAYPSPVSLRPGGSRTVNPSQGPSDDGAVVSIDLLSVSPGFTGEISVDDITGVVTIEDAEPLGSYTVTVRATDDEGASTDASFTLNVVDLGVCIPQTRLTANDGLAGDRFGSAVAIDGDTLVVGAPFDDEGGSGNRGAVYVYVRQDGSWTLQQKLAAGNGLANDYFGFAVDISGDTLIASAPGAYSAETPSAHAGKAYIFIRDGASWSQQAVLTASDGVVNDQFGWSVAISGETAVVGARLDDTYTGSAYVFLRDGVTWNQQQKLSESSGDLFGWSVDIDGETIAVGAPGDDAGANISQGAAYVYTRAGVSWSLQQQLSASTPGFMAAFGRVVALSNDTLAVGADLDDIGGYKDQGAAYVFTRSIGLWSEQQKITAVDGAVRDLFGEKVALSGDHLVASAWLADIDAQIDQGAAYAFTQSEGIWNGQQKLVASDGTASDQFGNAVALSGSSLAVGVWLDEIGAEVDQGSVYLANCWLADLIFADGFESGNLLNWSQRLRDGGDLAVTSQAALVGTKGMRAQIDDNNAIWVMDLSPEAERTYRVRFYFDPNSISMVEGDLHTIFAGIKYPGFQVLRVDLRRYLGNYQLRTLVRNDDQTWRNTRWVTISDAPHFIELFWQAALNPGANNGILTFWIDGVQKANLQNIDNDTRYIDRVRLGAVAGVDDGTRGTYYFDAFESRRQTYIGP